MRTGAAELKAGRDLERLYARHKRDVYRFVLRDVRDPDEAEDITQTAFLDAFRALRRGDEPQQPQAWLLTIAQNAARRRFRARAARPSEVELDAEFLAAPDREGPSADDIRLALERLRPARREALVLREIGGRSYIEIAAAMDMSVPAVETLLFRARQALRLELDDEAPRTRRRVLGGLLTWPAFGWDGYVSVVGWLSGRGASIKVAGALSAVALGTGVGIQQGLISQDGSDTPEASAAVPAERTSSADARAAASSNELATRARPRPKPTRQAARQPNETETAPSAGPLARATDDLTTALNDVTTDVARSATETRREVERVVETLNAVPERATAYIRKTPKVVSGIGALSAAEIPSASTLRVSTGSTMPSSQSRAVE
jgi:RNA polymerase sigma factor (sigma-70 family)